MALNRDDLAVLTANMSKEEVDRVHRFLHEWGTGPENNFPVQWALLTRAQLQAAATIPRAIVDNRKWMEANLAEYRKQTAAVTDEFSIMVDRKNGELQEIVSKHADVVERDALFVSNRLMDANAVAKNIQNSLQDAAAEWHSSRNALVRERQRFEQVCKKLDDAINLRGVHWQILGTLAACIIALLIGHYLWHP